MLQKSSTKTRIETYIILMILAKKFGLLQKPSTKTRIETSNLLEKGLIQKTVYLVNKNITKNNYNVFAQQKYLVSLVKLSF